MNISEIKFKVETKPNQPARTATVIRNPGDEYIKVTINIGVDSREHFVQGDCQDDVFSMAQCLQYQLEGHEGSNSEVNDYYRILENFMD